MQVASRQCCASSAASARLQLQLRHTLVPKASRRVPSREYDFKEVESVVRERLEGRNCLLVAETTQLIECIKTPEHAARCLDIIQRYVAQKQASLEAEDAVASAALQLQQQPGQPAAPAQAVAEDADELGIFLADWHHRKRFLARIAEIAVMELNKPELVFAIVGNWNRFKLSTYFGKDIIKQLGRYDNVRLEVLMQVAQLVQKQRGPAHKATRGALMALLEVMQDRGVATESMAGVKKALDESRRAQAAAAQPTQPAQVPTQAVPARQPTFA